LHKRLKRRTGDASAARLLATGIEGWLFFHPTRKNLLRCDPAVSSQEGSDETGIIVAGKDALGHGYVLEDLSGRYQRADWAKTAISAYHAHRADRIDRAKLGSPDRVDALVWALTELVIERVPFEGLLEYYRMEAARIRAMAEASTKMGAP